MSKVLVLVMIVTACIPLHAQTCCSAGTPLMGSLETSSAGAGVLQLGLRMDHNFLDDLVEGTDVAQDNTTTRSTTAWLAEINYGIGANISITGLFSMVNQVRESAPHSGRSSRLETNGIGDALIMIKYSLLSMSLFSQQELSAGAGIKAPLADSEVTSGGILIPADMQAGSGSWDGLLWAHYSRGFVPVVPLNVFATLSYRLNGTNTRYGIQNSGYKFGNELIVTAGAGYRTDTPFDFTAAIRYRNTANDELGGVPIIATGGDWLYAVPGINIRLPAGLTARVSGQLPLYRNLAGSQLTTTYSASFSVYYSFAAGSGIF